MIENSVLRKPKKLFMLISPEQRDPPGGADPGEGAERGSIYLDDPGGCASLPGEPL